MYKIICSRIENILYEAFVNIMSEMSGLLVKVMEICDTYVPYKSSTKHSPISSLKRSLPMFLSSDLSLHYPISQMTDCVAYYMQNSSLINYLRKRILSSVGQGAYAKVYRTRWPCHSGQAIVK